MRSIGIVLSVALAVALLSGRTFSNGEEPATRAAKPLLVLSGAASEVKDAGYHRVSSADKLKQIWRSHLGPAQDRGDNPVPEVDFDRCVVLALFEGSKSNSHGLRITEVLERDNETIVRFDDISYQSFGNANAVAPFAFVVLPASDKLIVVEENVQQYLADPPKWKEVARLTAGKQ
jgi:hypothetical protein